MNPVLTTLTKSLTPPGVVPAIPTFVQCGQPRVDRMKKLNTKPPLRRNRPTKVALREMAKIRRLLGLPERG